MKRLEHEGQTLVEFALVLSVFMLMVVGLLDGLRVAFYYNQVQEAARAGSRWGAVEVTRDGPSTWGDFTTTGNAPGTYYNCTPATCPNNSYPITSTTIATGALTPTIVGAVARNLVAANLRQATVSISTTIPISISTGSTLQPTEEITPTNPLITNRPVTVTVEYPFKPILGMVFGGVTINLKGSSTTLHE
jgi:Flp pilus assembly protein TadG